MPTPPAPEVFDDSTGPEAPRTVDAEGRLRPAFVVALPDAPELHPLVAAFERGDYSFVRAEADKALKGDLAPEVRAAIVDLRRRVDPDPLVLALLGGAVALFIALVVWSYV